MNAMVPILILGGLAFVAFAVYSFQQDSKRRQALAGFAASNGWTYTAEDDAFASRWNGTPFGEGERRRARNVVTGASHGRPFVGFDYSYETESTDGKGNRTTTTHRYSVVCLRLPTWLPGLQVTPDNILTRAAAAVGIGTGIELESEDFNRQFHVSAHDPKFASDVLTPRTMEAMLAADHLAWRIEGNDIVAWGSGRTAATTLLSRTALLAGVVQGIPEFVWHDNGYDPTAGAQPAPPSEGSKP